VELDLTALPSASLLEAEDDISYQRLKQRQQLNVLSTLG
jgi:hypothetical protein